ncbi:MAG: D-glycerate dehydrogenase [Rhodospirillales bacterium CG15_BIG_FIL_POST_REV_8_21_14_020_66_15]|nr:MAG: D-glycerate dehydrogenase [Rhodospirillales bacterium CG15_BIG_FIL_POST_REV_8_21_14_020_66_15]
MPDNKPRLLVARVFPPDVMARAARDYDCVVNDRDANWTGADVIARAGGVDAILTSARTKYPADVIRDLPATVRMLATFSVGYEHIDIAAAKARGLVVSNTPDVLTEAVADLTILLLLAASRRAREAFEMLSGDRWVKIGGWKPTQFLGAGPQGKVLGILGMGRIGRAAAARARAMGMVIHYHNRSRLAPDLEQGAVYHDTPQSLLKVSQFLSIHCESTPETRHLVNREGIALMPPGAIVVNTARGDIIDDDALIEALESGRLAAAGLDVFNGEPDVDKRYFTLKNAFILPHIGSATVETRNAMGFRALDNLDAFFRGAEPRDRLA